MSAPASPAIRHATTAAVGAVGLIAAIVSYSHMQQLGLHHGESWRSYLIPISIDGLMAAASMVLLTRRRNGLPTSPLAWIALGLGGIASLAANMADAQPNGAAILYAGWAPLGFLLAFELLLQQRRAEVVVAETPADNTVIDGLRAEVAQLHCDIATERQARRAIETQLQPRVVVATAPPQQVQPVAARKTQSAAAEKRGHCYQELKAGRDITGAELDKLFPTTSRDGARVVKQQRARLQTERRAAMQLIPGG